MHNDKYDEALELSQSAQSLEPIRSPPSNTHPIKKSKEGESVLSKSQTVANRHFDEALEISHSNSDDSVQTPSKSTQETKMAELEPMKKPQPSSLSDKSEHSKGPSHVIFPSKYYVCDV